MGEFEFKQELAGEELEISEVQAEKEEEILSKPNVVGLGVGSKIKDSKETGARCLSVFVSQKLDKGLLGPKENIVDKKAGKFDTDVIETGDIFAGGVDQEEVMPATEEADIQVLRNRVRPVEGGYSVGHYRITAGTYATAVYDSGAYPGTPRKYYVLSNNHVLANSNNARIGDPILQPGPYDGGRYPQDMIARLSRFVPVSFGRAGTNPNTWPSNYVDAAIAEGEFHVLDREIYWIGYVKGFRGLSKVGEIVQKTGRTTNWTTGKVTALNATVNVNYGGGQIAKMVRQIVTTNMSAGGDSGSLTLDMNENAVGLLFAGSATHTIMNDIRYVMYLLRIRIV